TTVSVGELDDLEECDGGDTGHGVFDLTQNKNNALDGQSPLDYTVSYHESEQDAEDGENAIEDPQHYENTENPQTIWIRVEANTFSDGDCYATDSFEIEATPSAPIADPTPLKACDGDNDGFYDQFDLHSKDEEITLGNEELTVSYHLTESDANNGVNPIGVDGAPDANVNPYSQIVWVRIEDEANGCVLITTLELKVFDTPQLTHQEIPDLNACDTNEDGTAVFDLTENNPFLFMD